MLGIMKENTKENTKENMKKNIKIFALLFLFCAGVFGSMFFMGCDDKVEFEVRVSTSEELNLEDVKIKIVDFSGEEVAKSTLSNSIAKFNLKAGDYVAVLENLNEEYDYPPLFFTKNRKKGSIAIKKSMEGVHTLAVFVKNYNAQKNYILSLCTNELCTPRILEGEKEIFETTFGVYDIKLEDGREAEIKDFNFGVNSNFAII